MTNHNRNSRAMYLANQYNAMPQPEKRAYWNRLYRIEQNLLECILESPQANPHERYNALYNEPLTKVDVRAAITRMIGLL